MEGMSPKKTPGVFFFHSALKLVDGSTFAALSAGTSAARQPIAASEIATVAKVPGSFGGVAKRKLLITFVVKSAPPMPTAVPIAIGTAESRTIVPTT